MPRPNVGDRAPDFTLPDAGGAPVRLVELLSKKAVVLYFYPQDQTPGCTAESCAFRDAYDDFTAAGAEVVGVSRDDGASHLRFAARHKLPFVLLSDPDGRVHDLYGIRRRLGFIRDRVTFVIDRGGIVRHVFTSMIDMQAHVNKALPIVRDLVAGRGLSAG
jgi:thioredoxin-dependent peroxiredoxin